MFYKRYTDSTNVPSWGGATVYFDIDESHKPIRQIEVYTNGSALKYDINHRADNHSELYDRPLFTSDDGRKDWATYQISEQEFNTAWNQNYNTNGSRRKVLGYVLGGVSFIPLIGVPVGIAAIIVGAIRKQKGPVILGILGILVSVVLYGSLFYFGFAAKTGPFADLKTQLVVTEMNQDKGQLALYYQQNGQYPSNLSVIQPSPSTLFYTVDPWGHPFIYSTSSSGKNYTLCSSGPDGIANNSDDICSQ